MLEEAGSPTKIRKEEDSQNLLRKNLADSFKNKSNFLTLQSSNQKFLNKTARFTRRKMLCVDTPRVNPQALL